MEENIANILNNSIFSGEITDDLRQVCEDYFCTKSDEDSDDSELEDGDDNLAEPLEPEHEELQIILPENIPDLQDIIDNEEILFFENDEVAVEEVVEFEEEGSTIDHEENNFNIWEGLVENDADFDAEIRAIHIDGCCKSKCSERFSLDELLSFYLDCKNMDYMQEGTNMLDLYILGQIKCMCRTQDEVKVGRGSMQKERKRQRVIFMLAGESVCQKLFLAVNAIKIKRYKRLLKHFKEHGLQPPVHKNFKRTPKKTITRSCLEKVVLFIRNHAEENALFMPGRLANHKVIVKLLPSSDTKQKLFLKYKEICKQANEINVGRTVFYNIWKTFCSDIAIMRPRTDLCEFCQRNITSHAKLRGTTEEEKRSFYDKCQRHIELVTGERASYKSIIKKTVEDFSLTEVKKDESGLVIPNSYDKYIHYSFDFAQQVHIPFDSQQPGPIYFLTPFKVGLFGIMNDTKKIQHNFLVPESIQITKGANTIVSYLHYYLERHSSGEKHLYLHADNCVAQNKNNIMLGYLCWRIINGLNETITLSFLPVGHTKFSCDWAFGLLKNKFRKCKVSSLAQLEEVVHSSTPSGLNQTILTGNEKGEVFVPMYDWLKYFKKKGWKACKDITKYLHFNFSKEHKGVVHTKVNLDGNTIKNQIAPDTRPTEDFPDRIVPEPMTHKRRKYLYDKIRPYCEDIYKDLLCPDPGVDDEQEGDERIENEDYNLEELPQTPSPPPPPINQRKRKRNIEKGQTQEKPNKKTLK